MKNNKYGSDFKVYNNRENFKKKERKIKEKVEKRSVREEIKELRRLEDRHNRLAYSYNFKTNLEIKYGVRKIIYNEKFRIDIFMYSLELGFWKYLKGEFCDFNIEDYNEKIEEARFRYKKNPEWITLIKNLWLKRKLERKLKEKSVVIKKLKI